jgi:hypothetical protein
MTVHAHESTVETDLSTVEDKKEEEKDPKFIACKFFPASKVPEDIFPPQLPRACHFSV